VTLPWHVSTELHATLHFCALHVMSDVHAPDPSHVMSHRDPPQLIGFVHETPPLQCTAHALEPLQSIMPLQRK
jgi:hypothetical protein